MRFTRRWFLPEVPPVLEMLHEQFEITRTGMAAFARWAASGGDPEDAQAVRDAEHGADDHKRELRVALREAFSTPLDREDLYLISERLDNVLNQAKDVVRESEIMAIAPDAHAAEMAALLSEGVGHLDAAVELLLSDAEGATNEADAATKCQRRLERVYRQAMSELLEEEDLKQVTASREMYRRFIRVGDHLATVAERVWYTVVKES